MKNILFAASESVPFIKTGGLADVVGSLPKNLDKELFDARVIMPKYTCIPEKFRNEMTYIGSFYMEFNRRNRYVGVMSLVYEGITYYFVDNEEYFGGSYPYGDMLWDIEKFGFFSKAVLSVLPMIDFRPDIIHCHDWHSSLVPVYLKTLFAANEYYRGIKAIMTIHNLKFQGTWDIGTVRAITGLPDELFTPDKLECFKDANCLKGGIVYSDAVTTVSETYVEETKTPFYGERLDSLLWARRDAYYGIVNGIDYDSFNPKTDKAVPHNYGTEDFAEKKRLNKLELQKQLGLREADNMMLIGIVSRLTDQKGFDLIGRVFEELIQDNIQFVILGTGEWKYEEMFRYFAGKYPDKVSANTLYSDELARRIYAASDAFLMPSLFEPCGLSQLISLRYGTLPIVRETGGLKDTVKAYNEFENSGTGFSFANYNAHEMMATVRYAENIYYGHYERWNQMVKRALEQDFSWKNSAIKYEKLYMQLLEG